MIKNMEHASFTVSDLEESLHFYRDLLGLAVTPIMNVELEEVRKIIGMPEASLRISIISLPDGNKIELIEYVHPKGKSVDLATCNTGVAHLAFEVDDIQAMYQSLCQKGIEFVSPPVWAPGNDGTGQWGVCYLRGPDGVSFELIEKKA
jgi:catechol 2,3-dioxygenase-like lactoylglutathione lyase family enzyme